MSFPFNIYLLAFCSALACSAVSLPLWRKFCERTGHVDDPGHRKIHSTPIPLAGGLAVMTGFFVPIVCAAVVLRFMPHAAGALNSGVTDLLAYGLSRRALQLFAILGGALGMVILGWLDDRYELGPGMKFGGQILIALLVALSGIRITLFIPNQAVHIVLTVFWILAVTNAFNFMDNMNGLCSGLGIIAAWCCAWAGAIQGQYLVAILAFLICGGLLGFFPFNFPKASAFLGDAGSHLAGFLAAVLAILPSFYSKETPHPAAVLSPFLILSMPLFDQVSVIVIRLRLGKPVYVGDTNHISHRLTRRGFSKTTAVLLILLGNAITGAIALLGFAR